MEKLKVKLNYTKPRFWKIVFTFMIAIFHFNNIYPALYQRYSINDGWYIGVEFFFLTSGVLLAHKSSMQKEKEVHVSLLKN